jgi:hypothetical protein
VVRKAMMSSSRSVRMTQADPSGLASIAAVMVLKCSDRIRLVVSRHSLIGIS